MVSPVSFSAGANGSLNSYTFATAKQAKAVQSALDNAYNSTSHKNAIKALNTLTAGQSSSSTASSTAKPSASQVAANNALITVTALANANALTQKFITAHNASSSNGTQNGYGATNGSINFFA